MQSQSLFSKSATEEKKNENPPAENEFIKRYCDALDRLLDREFSERKPVIAKAISELTSAVNNKSKSSAEESFSKLEKLIKKYISEVFNDNSYEEHWRYNSSEKGNTLIIDAISNLKKLKYDLFKELDSYYDSSLTKKKENFLLECNALLSLIAKRTDQKKNENVMSALVFYQRTKNENESKSYCIIS